MRWLKAARPGQTSLAGLSALYGALIDVHCNDLPEELKAQLRREARG